VAAEKPLPDSRPHEAPAALTPPAAVARLSRLTDCRWSEQSSPPHSEQLVVGQELELVSGRAELRFASGAQVIVQGPARLELESENGAVLHAGIATVRVPPQAIGFTLWSPTMAVVDLGTEFGMRVSDHGTTDLQVFEGEVEAEWAPTQSRVSRTLLIAEESAARFDRASGTMSRVPPEQVDIPRLAFAEPAVVADSSGQAGGEIVADFSQDALGNHVDEYPGLRGSGWATPWNPLWSSKVESERTIASLHPLVNEGNYLSLSHRSSLEGINCQTRVYERRQYVGNAEIELDQPHTISWLWRLDAMAGFDNPRGDYFKCFDSARFASQASDDETTWEIVFFPKTSIQVVDGGRRRRTNLQVVIGHVYACSVEVDPQKNRYRTTIRQFDPAAENTMAAEYVSPTLTFRNSPRDPRRVGGYLHFGPGLDHSDNDGLEPEMGTQVMYSLDRIRISLAGGEGK
jgi:hypothetical protein